jgi:hypothetical protein
MTDDQAAALAHADRHHEGDPPRPSQTWGLCRAPEGTTGPPFGGDVITFKGTVHYRASNLEHQVRTARRPTYLLLSIHPVLAAVKTRA